MIFTFAEKCICQGKLIKLLQGVDWDKAVQAAANVYGVCWYFMMYRDKEDGQNSLLSLVLMGFQINIQFIWSLVSSSKNAIIY